MAVAELLRQARERRALTLEQLAYETKIPRARLAAFEHDGFRPAGGFYERAQIRAYAHALNLDERLVVEQLDQNVTTTVPVASPQPAPRPGRFGDPFVGLIIAGFVVVAFAASALLTPEPQAARINGSVPARVSSSRSELPVPRVQAEASVQLGERASRATAGTTEHLPVTSATPSAPGMTVTQLVITSQPEGARVTVDGIGWGVTPVTIRHLPAGLKRIRLTSDGYTAAERVVRVHPQRTSRVSVALLPVRSTTTDGY